jgi:hypothetical protein
VVAEAVTDILLDWLNRYPPSGQVCNEALGRNGRAVAELVNVRVEFLG